MTYGLRMQLNGLGTVGDGALAGNEESLTTVSDAVVINQLRHAVRSAGACLNSAFHSRFVTRLSPVFATGGRIASINQGSTSFAARADL